MLYPTPKPKPLCCVVWTPGLHQATIASAAGSMKSFKAAAGFGFWIQGGSDYLEGQGNLESFFFLIKKL